VGKIVSGIAVFVATQLATLIGVFWLALRSPLGVQTLAGDLRPFHNSAPLAQGPISNTQ
jgi:hypothetical protein